MHPMILMPFRGFNGFKMRIVQRSPWFVVILRRNGLRKHNPCTGIDTIIPW